MSIEPESSKAPAGWKHPVYVIQEHNASHLHWDLRLEREGVLKSWALPKEPPTTVGERRLAIEVEDHTLDYAAFEGVIPEGYGAGTVKTWDYGTFTIEHWSDAKAVVHIKGRRLKGRYALVKLKNKGKNWILFKAKEDASD
jgi:bifunctional non-homologous end joining protein LigD